MGVGGLGDTVASSGAPCPHGVPIPGGPGDAGDTSVTSYVMRMKEFERERRLLQRQKRLRRREEAAAAATAQ